MSCEDSYQTTLKETVDCFKQRNRIKNVNKYLLPIFHVTTYKNFKKILKSRGVLYTKKEDDFFKEKIIFFSYGKMSYIPKPLTEVQVLKFNQFPVALIYESNTYTNIFFDRLVCLDSGALMNGRFNNIDELDKFDVSIDNPRKIDIVQAVMSLYDNITNYIDNKIDVLKNKVDEQGMSFFSKLAKLYNILPDEDVHCGIDQATTFELHKKEKFELTPDKVLIPRNKLSFQGNAMLLMMNTIRDKFDDNKIRFLVYDTNKENLDSRFILKDFQDKAKEYIKKKYGTE